MTMTKKNDRITFPFTMSVYSIFTEAKQLRYSVRTQPQCIFQSIQLIDEHLHCNINTVCAFIQMFQTNYVFELAKN